MSSYQVPQRQGDSLSRFLKRFIVTIMSLLIIGAAVIGTYYSTNMRAVGGLGDAITVIIAEGSDVGAIAARLKESQVIRDARVFSWYLRVRGIDSLIAGTYRLNKTMSVPEIAAVLSEGRVTTDLVTILPAQRLDQIKEAFVKSGYDAASVEAAMNPSLYGSHPVFAGITLPPSLEGFLYPESFLKSGATTPEDIIRLSLDEMNIHLTSDIRQKFLNQGLSVYEGLILSSIVEQEVHIEKDKNQVAQVFLLRLKSGIPLGSDPTAFYESRQKGLDDSVAYDSPYNTRLFAGLPPTPIGNITASTLAAVANPAAGDYLYFVAGDDGITHFSRTLAEHEALTAQYCTVLCGR